MELIISIMVLMMGISLIVATIPSFTFSLGSIGFIVLGLVFVCGGVLSYKSASKFYFGQKYFPVGEAQLLEVESIKFADETFLTSESFLVPIEEDGQPKYLQFYGNPQINNNLKSIKVLIQKYISEDGNYNKLKVESIEGPKSLLIA